MNSEILVALAVGKLAWVRRAAPDLLSLRAARLLGVDAFDQPAVELSKVLTRERLAQKS